jgi:hypothetical protein
VRHAVAKTRMASVIAEVFATSCICDSPPKTSFLRYALDRDWKGGSILRMRQAEVVAGSQANEKVVAGVALVQEGEETAGKTDGPENKSHLPANS